MAAEMGYAVETVRAGTVEMDVIRFGTGPRPFVLLPGVSLQPIAPSGELVAKQYRRFWATHTVFLPERRRNMPATYSVRQMTDDTVRVLEAMGVCEAADVAGMSQGGMMALCMAIDHPQRVRRLLVGCSAARPNATLERTLGRWGALAAAGTLADLKRAMFEDLYGAAFREKFRVPLEMMAQELDGADAGRFLAQVRACESFDRMAELSRVKCPTLVLGAKDDRVLSAAASEEMAAAIGCECQLLENCGHAAFDEAPEFMDRMGVFFGVG